MKHVEEEMVEIKLYKYSDEHIRYYGNYCYCGEPGEIGQEAEEWVPVSDILKTSSTDSYIAEIFGDSMEEADIKRGDKAVIDTTKEPKDQDIVLALVDGNLTLKYLTYDRDGNTWLVPANERYKPMLVDFSKDTNSIIGVMVSLVRSRPAFDTVLANRMKDAYEKYKSVKVKDDEEKPFMKLIPNGKDKKQIMLRLHKLLDGKEGVEIIKVLYAARCCEYIEKMPSEGVLNGEFDVRISHSQYYRDKNKYFSEDEVSDYIDALR